MKKHLIDFPENNISIESFYERLRPCYDSIMQFGDRVLVAQMNWNGMLEGAVYGFVEDPEEGWSPIECRLELLKISDETYTDAGHAIEWCPKWLEPEAKKEWRRLAKQMEAIGILTEVDMAAFAGYCQAYARWKEAEEFITQHQAHRELRERRILPSPVCRSWYEARPERVSSYNINVGKDCK